MAGKRNTDGFSVRKPPYTGRDGKRRESSRYHISFKDHNAVWRRLVAFTDHSASVAYGRKLRALADLRAAGEPPRGELAQWVNDLPPAVLGKLLEWDIVDARASRALRPLSEHLEDWRASIHARRKTGNHVQLVHTRAERIINACGFTRFAEIDGNEIELLLAKWRTREESPISVQTSNHYLRALKQFCKWTAKRIGAAESPVAGLEMLNPKTDRKLVRRALAVEELTCLIATTGAEDAPDWRGTPGVERALIYSLVAETGLRANEVRTLAKAAFDLDGDEPTVTVKATYSKRREEDVLPIRPALAVRLRAHLSSKLPAARAFRLHRLAARMLAADLDRAAIPAETEAGVIDFHSLRVTFITNLARGGVHPRVAQALARHSTMDLTMATYTKLRQDEQRAGLDALPAVSAG